MRNSVVYPKIKTGTPGNKVEQTGKMNSVSNTSFERLLNDDLNLQISHNTVPAGILVIIFDDGRVVFSNRYFADSLGVGGDQLLGADWEAFFYDKGECERLMVAFVKDDEVKDFELRLRTQDTGTGGKATLAQSGRRLLRHRPPPRGASVSPPAP